MASTTSTTPADSHSLLLKRKNKVCFSIAAYSKDLIANLHHHSNVPIDSGLTNHELTTIESTFNFTFPPDLRSILREGLPIGHGFPNWRSSSFQQLHILINLPIFGLVKQISRQNFWHKNWGNKPDQNDDAVKFANEFLRNHAPVLVPVYRNCYVPATPCVAGNPVFYVSGLEVRLLSYDVVLFFQQTEFNKGGGLGLKPMTMTRLGHFLSAPLWAATESRTIEFWSELVDHGGDRDRKWWLGGSELGRFLESVRVKLRNGGWDEKEVDEMMEINGGDQKLSSSDDDDGGKGVGWHVRELAGRLLGAGWSSGDVVESLGCLTLEEDWTGEIENECGGDSLFDLEYNRYSCVGDGQGQSASLGPVLKRQVIANN